MAGNDHGRAAGLWGEEVARRFLRNKGCRILGTRVRVGRRDEIDIVAREGDVLVFVEVKTRAEETFGRPIESVDRRKRRALCRAAVRYLKDIGFPKVSFRFDVVEVVGEPEDPCPAVTRTENAFVLDRKYYLPS